MESQITPDDILVSANETVRRMANDVVMLQAELRALARYAEELEAKLAPLEDEPGLIGDEDGEDVYGPDGSLKLDQFEEDEGGTDSD